MRPTRDLELEFSFSWNTRLSLSLLPRYVIPRGERARALTQERAPFRLVQWHGKWAELSLSPVNDTHTHTLTRGEERMRRKWERLGYRKKIKGKHKCDAKIFAGTTKHMMMLFLLFCRFSPLFFLLNRSAIKKKLSEQTNKFCNRRREGEIDLPFAHAFYCPTNVRAGPQKSMLGNCHIIGDGWRGCWLVCVGGCV